MIVPKNTFICPYCFEKVKIADVQFRCTNRLCGEFDDIEMTKYENGDLSLPKKGKRTFSVPNKVPFTVPDSGICPECQKKSHKKICPNCHNELPESSLTGRDIIISIVGSRATGKTHFVGVLIKELRDRISVSFGGSLESFAESYKRWMENCGNKLYNENSDMRKTLELTQSSVQNVDNGAYRPLIFKLKLRHNGLFKKSIDSFTFVFYDSAGEDLNDEDTMSTVNKYICKSAGVIFLLDPMQISAVSNQLDDDTVKRASGKGISHGEENQSDDIMTRVSNLIRNERGLKEDDVIDIPVAAVFSKFDAIEPLIPEGSTVLEPSPHCREKVFDMTDWHNVDSEIKAMLNEWGENSFTSQLETNYKKYSFFAVSALGLNNNPSEEGKIDRPRPHRIEDPVLWLLKENGIIDAK